MTAKPREVDKAVLSISVTTLVTCLIFMVGALVSGTWTAAMAFKNIQNKMSAAWTLEDAQRQQNWLRQDNAAINLKVRDSDDIVRARYVVSSSASQ